MSAQKFKNVLLSMIRPNPQSPRKKFGGPEFDELVESIKEQGIIEPIIIRPIVSQAVEGRFEVVAGDRRFKAACRVAEGMDKRFAPYKIPAIIRDLSEEEAFDLMITENLQREDLTEKEEAESFKMFLEQKGDGALMDLAKRTAISPSYIRRRIAVLSLPGYALKAWDEGKIKYGHLEQLLRLKEKKDIREMFDAAVGGKRYWSPLTAQGLKEKIDEMAIHLKHALFDKLDEGCLNCGHNSMVQKRLWDIAGLSHAHCLDPACFKKKQNNYLLGHWKETGLYKNYKTTGFRFDEDINWQDHNAFHDWGTKPTKKCKKCSYFVSLISPIGEISAERTCVGDKGCFNAIRREQEKAERGKEKKPEGGPRVSWHGEYFREAFFEKMIPQKFEGFKPSDLKIAHLAVFSFLKLDRDLLEEFAEKAKLKQDADYHYRFNEIKIIEQIKKMDHKSIQEFLKKAALKVVLDKNSVYAEGRLAAAKHLGINLAKEWAVTEEYLQKKTIKEMLEFGKKSGIFKDKKAEKYLVETLKKKAEAYHRCKKTELIEIFLKSGVELIGKVPDEILQH